ncbi:hypothetical protein ACFV0T_34035 [Streptomyces sp. NPDC059582]|uniref:hypothetical protein n=1 Tax=Streptomyces sp. NPDC059582 TaxID=3346875 RepID=UPI00369AB461
MGVVGLVMVAIVVGIAADGRYRQRVADWAAGQGWAYQNGGGGPWTKQLDQGFVHGVKFQLEGARRGRRVLVAHWWFKTRRSTYTRGEWESETETHDRMVAVVRLPTSYMHVRVERRGGGSRLARSLGLRDPAAVGHAAFDRDFRIRGDDAVQGRRLFTRQLIEAHLAGHVPLWSVRGPFLMTAWEGKVDPAKILARVDLLLDVADLLRQ